jgi:colanic acid/amylovoran biosynthesis glycosyltransferase
MRRRIAFLVNRFPTVSETFLLDEILDLKRRGLEIEIFSLKRKQESSIAGEAKILKGVVHHAAVNTRAFWSAQFYWLSRYPSVYIRCWRKALSNNFTLPSLLRVLWIVPVAAYFATFLKEKTIDHVHAHRSTDPALASYVIRLLTGVSYSVTCHAKDIHYDRKLLNQNLTMADFVVTVSEVISKTLGHLFGIEISKKIHVIRCGIDPERFCEPSKRIRRHPKVPFTILSVASLSAWEGHRYLIDACVSLKEHGVPFRCLVAGDGPERRKLESQIAKLGLKKEVRLFGLQDRKTVHNLMKEADVFASPCVETSEGIAVALIDAMAVGIPVVATSICGVEELVKHGETGLLVPPRDAASMAAAIYLIFSESDAAREMALAAKSKVLNEFNLHVNSGTLYRLLSGVEQHQQIQPTAKDLEFLENENGWAC